MSAEARAEIKCAEKHWATELAFEQRLRDLQSRRGREQLGAAARVELKRAARQWTAQLAAEVTLEEHRPKYPGHLRVSESNNGSYDRKCIPREVKRERNNGGEGDGDFSDNETSGDEIFFHAFSAATMSATLTYSTVNILLDDIFHVRRQG
jgi:hypothetical protein